MSVEEIEEGKIVILKEGFDVQRLLKIANRVSARVGKGLIDMRGADEAAIRRIKESNILVDALPSDTLLSLLKRRGCIVFCTFDTDAWDMRFAYTNIHESA